MFDWSNNTGAIDVKIDGFVLEEKSSFNTVGLNFSSKINWGSCNISVAKTTLKQVVALICSIRFHFPEVALYLYKYTIQLCMEYFSHVWNGAASCYLELTTKMAMLDCLSFTCCLS